MSRDASRQEWRGSRVRRPGWARGLLKESHGLLDLLHPLYLRRARDRLFDEERCDHLRQPLEHARDRDPASRP
eukprot:10282187-Alexandrium_andersonii.AAC.1